MLEALVSALNTELTDEQRYVIILRFLEDFSLKETAEILGKDVNNIKVMQNRGIARLRKFLTLYSVSQFTGDSTRDGWPPEMNKKGEEKFNDHET